MDLKSLSISKIHSLFEKKELSVTELVTEFTTNLKKTQTNAVITDLTEQALEVAKNLDKQGFDKNKKLFGIPMGVKDVFCTKGIKTTCASKMLEHFIPDYESTTTQRFLDEGAINIAKLNQDEFCMGSGAMNSYFEPVINPLSKDTPLVAGGSSGGSAAAMADDLCQFSIGTDTGGSVRLPAAFCDLFGMRPSYGRCSRYGIIAFASSLDTPGFLTKSTEDMEIVLNIASGSDVKDQTTYTKNEEIKIDKNYNFKGKKIAILKESFSDEVDPCIRLKIQEMIDFAKSCGSTIEIIEMPISVSHGINVYYAIASAEMSSNLARFDGLRFGGITKDCNDIQNLYRNSRTECLGEEVQNRIILGNMSLSEEYIDEIYFKGTKVRRLIYHEFNDIFKKFDFVVTPTTSSLPFEVKNNLTDRQMWFNDIFTIPSALAGVPAISIPAGYDITTGLPIGIQLISNIFTESLLLSASYFIEKNLKNETKTR